MKLNIKMFIAMLAMALFTINAQAQNLATAPSTEYQMYQSSGKTHGTVTVNPNAYKVGTATATTGKTAPATTAPVYKAPGLKGGVARGASATAGTTPFRSNIGSTPKATNQFAGGSIIANGAFADEDEDVTPGGYAGGVVPVGNAVLPLMALLLCYALFLAGRAYVRKNKEEKA